MSEIAGNTSILIAAELLSNANGGHGVMMGGIPGVKPTEVVILGSGGVGEFASLAALKSTTELIMVIKLPVTTGNQNFC